MFEQQREAWKVQPAAAASAPRRDAGPGRLHSVADADPGTGVDPGTPDAVTLAELESFLARVTHVDADVDDAAGIDQVAALERIKAACAASQARLTASIHANQAARDQARHVDRAQAARSVGTQIVLARRQTPHRGNQHLGLALALTREMPHTLDALTGGRISEWQATLLVRATACLSVEDRGRVDTDLAPKMGSLSDRRLEAAAKAAAARLDPASVAARRRNAEGDRRVTLRPAPDTMTHLTGLLPVKDGVACYAALTAAADAARAAGDRRSRGQVMADTLTARVTGREAADGADVEINLIVPTDTFLGYGKTPAWVPEYGPIPADLAYLWAHGTPRNTASTGADPTSGGTDHRTPAGETLHPAPVRHPRHEPTRRHGKWPARIHRAAREIPAHPRPDLPHARLRRPDPAPGPHHPPHRRWRHHRDQRARPM